MCTLDSYIPQIICPTSYGIQIKYISPFFVLLPKKYTEDLSMYVSVHDICEH